MSEEEVSSEEQESTPTPEESAPQAESEGAEPQEAAPVEPKEEPQVPFHEHPRFKELIEERRAFKEQLDQAKGYMEAMQKEMQALRQPATPQKKEEPYKQLLDQIEQVNPQFAAYQRQLLQDLEQAKSQAGLAKEVQSRLEQYETRETQTQALNRFQSLMEQNKIPEGFKKRYEREVRALAVEEESQGTRLTVKDVDRLFKSVHDEFTPFIEGIKRESLKGYVKDKKQDATPAAATGGAAVSKGAGKLPSMDTQDGFQKTTKWLAEQLRAAKKV